MNTINRIESGIPGLDSMLYGGFLVPSSVLIAGEPGTGKTTFVLQSLFYGASKDQQGLYITAISEPPWLSQRYMSSFSFYDESVIEKEKIVFVDIGDSLLKDPLGIVKDIESLTEKYRPKRLVIDPITPMKNLWTQSGLTRELIHELLTHLKVFTTFTLITSELTTATYSSSIEAYMVDGVILLSYPEENNVRRKYIEVLKMRGTKHNTGTELLEIDSDGIKIGAGIY